MTDQNLHPTEIRVRSGGATVLLTYANGDSYPLSAELLRVYSPSSEVQGYHRHRPLLQKDKEAVRVVTVEPVGHYALRIRFDDGHKSGLYTWPYLYDLASRHEQHMAEYLERLAAAGHPRKEAP